VSLKIKILCGSFIKKSLLLRITSLKEIGMVVRSVLSVIHPSQLSIYSTHMARLICRVVHFTFSIPPPTNVTKYV
jgi:hypothetical protein